MPLDQRDASRVQDMLDDAGQAIEILDGRTREEMVEDLVVRLALVRCLEVIGEAANHVGESVRDAHRDIPWELMAGMRHRLIHDYGNTNFTIVYDVVRGELPALMQRLRSMLGQAKPSS